MNEILKKLKKIEVQIRNAVQNRMHGDFHSIFKGSGIEFTDVRDYQYGDDIRLVDWNVSAKGHGTFVKNFHEEKEQQVLIYFDTSASLNIGRSTSRKKNEVAKEIAGVLAISAIKESGHVGLLCYSDQKELLIKPHKGINHAYFLILKLFNHISKSNKTDLNKGFDQARSLLKKKSLIIIISDFVDNDYENALKLLLSKHDVVVIQIADIRDFDFPSMGIIPIHDNENNKTYWVNSSSSNFKEKYHQEFNDNSQKLEQLCLKNNATYLSIDTRDDYVSKLIKMFNLRNK